MSNAICERIFFNYTLHFYLQLLKLYFTFFPSIMKVCGLTCSHSLRSELPAAFCKTKKAQIPEPSFCFYHKPSTCPRTFAALKETPSCSAISRISTMPSIAISCAISINFSLGIISSAASLIDSTSTSEIE